MIISLQVSLQYTANQISIFYRHTNGLLTKISVLFVVLIFVLLPNFAYASHFTHPTYGTIQRQYCTGIDGTVSNEAINFDDMQFVDFCKYDDRYFRVINSFMGGCVEAIGTWRDPETNRTYGFPTPCDVPRPCEESSYWGGGWYGAEAAKLSILHEGRMYNVTALSSAVNCGFEMDLAQKKISVALRGISNTTNSLEIAIPYEFLVGDYAITVNGEPVTYTIRKPSLSDIPDTSSYDLHRAKYYDTGLFERIMELINAGVTREFSLIFFGGDKDQTVEILKQHNATNISKGERLSFVVASVPVREIPKIMAYDFVGIIGFGAGRGIESSEPESIITIMFTFPDEPVNKLSEARVEIVGEEVIPEFGSSIAVLIGAISIAGVAIIVKLFALQKS